MTFEEFILKNSWLIIYDTVGVEDQDICFAESLIKSGLLAKTEIETITSVYTVRGCVKEGEIKVVWTLTEEGKKQALQVQVDHLSDTAKMILSLLEPYTWKTKTVGPKKMSELTGFALKVISEGYKELGNSRIVFNKGKHYDLSHHGVNMKKTLLQTVNS